MAEIVNIELGVTANTCVNIFQVYTSSAEEALRMSIFAQNVAKVTIIILMMKKNLIVEKIEKSLHRMLLGRSLLV